jgi:hypothetical protein
MPFYLSFTPLAAPRYRLRVARQFEAAISYEGPRFSWKASVCIAMGATSGRPCPAFAPQEEPQSPSSISRSSNSHSQTINPPHPHLDQCPAVTNVASFTSRQLVRHCAVVEWNTHACNTFRHNKHAKVEPISHWPDVTEGDVKHFKYDAVKGIDLLNGGPPCQPFSLGGKHVGFLTSATCFRKRCGPCARRIRARSSSRTCRG